MKSAFAMLIALVAIAGLVYPQESFDGTTTGSTSSGVNCTGAGGWIYPAGWSEDPLCGAGGANAWRPDNGGTPSGGTGPSGDVCNSGNYMMCEASGGNGTATFALKHVDA